MNKLALAGGLSLLALNSLALAEQADRNQPVHIEASRITIDDVKKIQILEGNVQLTQGTMTLRAEKLIVNQNANGYQKGIAYGSNGRPASFRQKREGKNEYIEGEAERIEHDSQAEKTELFGKARIKNGLDEVYGQFISYDARRESYTVSGVLPDSNANPSDGRVRVVIQPKNGNPGAPQ
ncbi:MAG: lipopolysaccharide transport periplasmic protein LptA [Zoogloeaceae bacterium]|jgi:lipopolysaccharide export system protein LptA|nr:lipopolysaccharide transport periplasmic protein LptA [Zoogloeaceae bacterium]